MSRYEPKTSAKLTIEVKRHRRSVTQGEAEVTINGKRIVIFGDEIEMIEDGQQYYGDKIGSWASTTPDSAFILGLLWHPYDDVYHYSKPVRDIILAIDSPLTDLDNRN